MKPAALNLGLKPDRLLQALEESGKTRTQVAKELRVNKATVGRWISGEREPETLEMLGKLCDALGRNLAYLTADDEAAQTPEEVLFLRMMRSADPTHRQAALAVLGLAKSSETES